MLLRRGVQPDPSPLPYEPHFALIDGQRLHYVDEGQGDVVLLLHGNPTWSFFYRNLIAALKADFRVIAPDYIGCGLSDHPANRHYRAVDRIGHLEELLRQLGVQRLALVMHDWGGPIGTGLAVRRPGAIWGLVYLNTTLSETAALPGIIKTAAAPLIGKVLTKYSLRFLRLMTRFGVARKLPSEVARAYFYPYRRVRQRTAIWDFVADIPFDSSHPSYPDMLDMAGKLPLLAQVPVKIVWGLRDPCFHREMLTQVASHFPQAEVLEIPQASHLVLEDAPGIAIPAVRDFLAGVAAKLEEKHAEAEVPAAPRPASLGNALASAFQQTAAEHPQQDAVIEPNFLGDTVQYTHTNYAALLALSQKYQRGLMDLGLRSGDKVLMLVSPGIDFLALSYAVMAAGGVPVFVDPGIGFDKMCACIADAAPDAFIGVPKAHLLRLLKPRLFRRLKFHLAASDWFLSGGPNLSFLKRFAGAPLPLVESTGTALIAFTSGATGTPKGVIFTDGMIRAQLDIFRSNFGLAPGGKDCPLLPIFSLFGLALGVCSVFPPLDPARPLSVDPALIVRLVRDLNVTYSFGSPTLWKRIAEYCVLNQIQLSSMRKIFMAGAPVPKGTLEAVQGILPPEGEAFTPYGATEALPVTLVSARRISAHKVEPALSGEQGVYVGSPVPGVDILIIHPVDGAAAGWQQIQVLGAGRIGEVIVHGPNVSGKYLNRLDANRQAKLQDPEGRLWHRTGDMGYLDSSHGLYLCGRKAHTVATADRNYYTLPVEAVFNSHPLVRRSALVAIGSRPAAPAVVVELQRWTISPQERRKLLSELRALAAANPLTAAIDKFFFHRSFPVDARHNAKIYRDELARWAAGEAARTGVE